MVSKTLNRGTLNLKPGSWASSGFISARSGEGRLSNKLTTQTPQYSKGLSKGDTSSGEVTLEETAPLTATEKEPGGLLGLVSNVFTPDGSQSFTAENLTVNN